MSIWRQGYILGMRNKSNKENTKSKKLAAIKNAIEDNEDLNPMK